MAIDLSDYEKNSEFEGDYKDALKAAQKRLAYVHFAHIIHKKRTVLAFEGWDAAGKGGVIRRMAAEWDPRYFEVYPVGAPTKAEKDRHFLWRFWRDLPGDRSISVFDRTWYGRVLVERVEGYCSEAEWRRGYDEINEFEAQQIDSETNIIKIFLHTTQETQDKRLADRLDTPEKRWKVTKDDFRNRAKRADYLAAYNDMFKNTDTRWAPWAVFDGNNKKAARIAVLNYVAERMEADVPTDFPEADPELLKLAEKAFGYKQPD
ncbi:polyphosphate kinase [Sphingorhabdus sp. Alg239-R122]|uniref:polyphosphate kinase 2 family protein n=1 Tax=Sphingorhabdus sp. Alg239-R122 TaxID=2305989 RepID=UPI0013DBB5D5|nr:polyphosphate kinase [Sphingorhabdus sp. Alg239-R122]